MSLQGNVGNVDVAARKWRFHFTIQTSLLLISTKIEIFYREFISVWFSQKPLIQNRHHNYTLISLLAPQSGAHRIAPHRDFHPTNPSNPTHPSWYRDTRSIKSTRGTRGTRSIKNQRKTAKIRNGATYISDVVFIDISSNAITILSNHYSYIIEISSKALIILSARLL